MTIKEKFTVVDRETNNSKNFKTLKEISIFLDLPYHQVRTIYLSSNKKFLHPITQAYCNKYDIKDNLELINKNNMKTLISI